jgi:hypothetical protein
MRPVTILIFATTLAMPAHLAAQGRDAGEHAGHRDHAGHASHAGAHGDSAYRAMQARGQKIMGVDQYTSAHQFQSLPDGGRIELQRDRDDSVGTAAIRAHLRQIARAFSAGDFRAPFAVHDDTVPGVPVLRARRSAISYDVSDLPRGAELRIHSNDAVAIDAIHRFLAYQRREHRTGSASRTP